MSSVRRTRFANSEEVLQKLKNVVRSLLPRTQRPHSIKSGPLKGFLLNTSWHDYPAGLAGFTERELLQWFERHVNPRETWLDVGAHYGYTAIALARLVGPEGRVYAFEPALATVGCLERTISQNSLSSVTVVPIALGNVAEISLDRASLHRGMIDWTQKSNGNHMSTALLTASLDWLWPRVAGANQKIHGIKIDVQGMELPALQGMVTLLRFHSPRLVIEFHSGVDRNALTTLLADCGYRRPGTPIVPNDVRNSEYQDNESYAFEPE